jgi:hypothetical protein
MVPLDIPQFIRHPNVQRAAEEKNPSSHADLFSMGRRYRNRNVRKTLYMLVLTGNPVKGK